MSDNPVFLYLASYPTEEDARADYEALKDLHALGAVGTYDAALVIKDDNGKVHVHKHEKPTQHGAWAGAAAGAVVGLLFPVTILGAAVVGAAGGGLIGHVSRGMSRSDVKELGDLLDEGQAGLVVVGESTLEKQIDKALSRAAKRLDRQLAADAKELEREERTADKERAAEPAGS